MTVDIISIASPLLSASINTLGAELWTLRDAAGRDLIWNGDGTFWTGRAPILFPIVGALANGSYRIGEATYALPQHGFGRRRRFTPIAACHHNATLRLENCAETRAVYPFDFALDLGFEIAGARLAVTATLTNTGDAPLPASFGYHPAFLWPLPFGAARADHFILFDEAETAAVFRPDANGLLVAAGRPDHLDGRTLWLDDTLFADGALVLTELKGQGLTYGAGDGHGLRISYPDTPHLGIWSKPGAPFVCVEPWQGYADPAGFTGEIWDKPGIVRLAPRERRVWRMGIELVGV
ncbi:aldose 1-epimerase family protein [Hyphomicrobium sp. LHD-15]|uniref:aldose 1-epimerase family protein n=1 Tax=Hyphomicrobium sp. LHD-15 TaxID=3072142 RepID=UPI00280F08F7|nr:aldose 1-epimerase family protein [Hyphomicrobium sp. LHD-15]MDQ8700291.1 aldose 1-epimerase family protein [Hyphomicrobium sp. LHD-15]